MSGANREAITVLMNPGRPSAKKINAGSAELARARSQQDEAESLFLDESVNLIQERGQPLDFVDNNPCAILQYTQVVGEPLGGSEICPMERLI